jgi:TonB-linked SusC/RagA family outer membrane protein
MYTYTLYSKTLKLFALLLFILNASLAFSQTSTITGQVLSSDDGLPLPGVVVKSDKGPSAVTNVDGKFSIAAAIGDKLTVSFLGFTNYTEDIKSNSAITIRLMPSISALDEVVVTGYTSQKKSDVTSAISTISGKEILKAPVTDVTNSLVGKVPGLIAQQTSGKPGNSQATLYVRGRVSANSTALIIVDGVERQSFGNIDPNEIESINVLKDAASAAMYGIKGANGVIVVTTKQGKSGKAKVSFTSNFGLVGYTGIPNVLPAYESALLHTEGQINSKSPTRRFTDEDLEIFKNGTGDPLLYPDVNWYDVLLRKQWTQHQQNVNVSGGSKSVDYFISAGYAFEDGIFKDYRSPLGYKTTPDFKRTNFRSNVGLKVTKSTTVNVNIAGRLENRYSIQGFSPSGDPDGVYANGIEGLMSRMIGIPSWGIPFFPEYANSSDPAMQRLSYRYNQIEDATLGVNLVNPFNVLTRGGYIQTDNNALESIISINQKLDALTEGLSFKGLLGYDAYISSGKKQTGNRAVYRVDRAAKDIVYTSGQDDPLSGITSSRSGYFKTNLQLSLNYRRQFDKHSFAGLLLGQRELRASESGANYSDTPAPYANQGIVFNLEYNYDSRYFVQFNGSYNGSENYPKSERYGFFPSISAGYTLSNESFLEDVSWLSLLKIRGSYGLVGIPSGNNRFYYQDSYSAGGGVQFGSSGQLITDPTTIHNKIGNPFVTWEKSIKRNIGLETSFFKDKLALTVDLFDDKRYDILLSRNNTSFVTYGEALPNVNYGENYNYGYETELKYQNNIGKFTYGITGQLTFARNKIVIADEAPNIPENLKTIGLPIGQFRGYNVLGFFRDQEDVNNSPGNGITSIPFIPGDLKYADINGDGIITPDDRVPVGYSNIPEYTYGIDLSLGYKGFSLSALFQGVENVSSDAIFFSNSRNQYYEPMLGRWTPDNQNATWPVIREGSAQGNPNETINDFYQQDASYLKLRNVQLRYQFPQQFTEKLKINGLAVFVSGQNLVTWTKFYGYDPENAYSLTGTYGSRMTIYPSSRIFNFGLNVQF